MFVKVTENNIYEAAKIHSASWKESHKSICSKEFIEQHNIKAQIEYLKNEIKVGKDLYMLVDNCPVGIVSIFESVIENLYVLPEEQHKGYGTRLLLFALQRCNGQAELWILETNKVAYNLYSKYGFKKTGVSNKLSENISELQMKKII